MKSTFLECQVFSGCHVILSLALLALLHLNIYISITSRMPSFGKDARFKNARMPTKSMAALDF